MTKSIAVVQRNEWPIDIIQWDGGQEAADWLTERFPNDVTFSGDDGNLQLKIWTTWGIERGWWIADMGGSPNPMAPDQLSQYTYPRRPIEVPELPPLPEDEPAPEPEPEPTPEPEPLPEPEPEPEPETPGAPAEQETDSGGNQ